MATALKIITRAFSKSGIRPAESPLSDAEISDALDVLNDLLSSWNATGILTGIDQIEDVNSETLIPREAEWAVKANLAIMLGPEYGIDVTQALARDATESLSQWIRSDVNLLEIQPPSTLPRGSGNQDMDIYDIDYYSPSGAAQDNF